MLAKATCKDTQIKFYKVMAVPTLLHSSECWVPRCNDLKILNTAEMMFLLVVQRVCTRLNNVCINDIHAALDVEELATQFIVTRRTRQIISCICLHIQDY